MRAHLAHALLIIPAVAALALPIACGGNVVVDEPSEGTGGGTTTTSSSSTTGTTTTGTTTTTSTGPSGCDNTGNCGDAGQGCVQCALEGDCAVAFDQCINDQTCTDYANCIQGCGGDACVQACAAQSPGGQALYNGLIICVFCNVCMKDCNGVADDYPGFPGCYYD
ncbi:MAG: hypothetical protein IT372_10180 [Polyangiaceae bacterium]|nr:hypothetical protein [Polyangiaceae bacterium]